MRLLQKSTIRTKLSLAFGAVLLTLVVLVGLALSLLSRADDEFAGYVDGINARALMAARVRAAIDARAIAARNLVLVSRPEEVDVEKAAVSKAHTDATDSLAQLTRMGHQPGVPESVRAKIAAIADVEAAYAPVALGIVDLALKGERAEAIRRLDADCRPLLAKLIDATESYALFTAERTARQIQETRADYLRHRNVLLSGAVVAWLLALAAGVAIERSLHRDLGAEPFELRALVGNVADGDLTRPISVPPGDEHSVLAAVSRMQLALTRIVATVRAGAEEVSAASQQISGGNLELASRTDQQASSLEQAAASMQQFGSTVRQNADSAAQADQLAQSASVIAEQGGEVVGQVVHTMEGISQSARKISDIIGVIDGISFQTNILALNAAVEAARAGEAGSGFAVVASEVRSLAGRSSHAAKEIEQLIHESVGRVTRGTELAESAGKAMSDIVGGIKRVTAVVAEISHSSREQSHAVTEVGEAVTSMDESTQRNAGMVQEMTASAKALQDRAHSLVNAVAVFRLPAERYAPC